MEVVGGDEVIGDDEDIGLDVLRHTLGPRRKVEPSGLGRQRQGRTETDKEEHVRFHLGMIDRRINPDGGWEVQLPRFSSPPSKVPSTDG